MSYELGQELTPQNNNFELIPEQVEAVDALAEARQLGEARCYINMATGTGKTEVIARDIKGFLGEEPQARVLHLSHKEEILEQNMGTFQRAVPERSHGRLFAGHREDQADIVYGMFQTMNGRLGGGKTYEAFQPDEFDYVVVDESHHGPAPTYREVIDYFQPTYLRGMTATPRRRDQQDMTEIFGPERYTFLLEDAIARERLVRPDYRVLTDHVRRVGEIQTDLGAMSLGQLNKEIFVRRRDGEIADMIAEHLYAVENPRTIVFCESIIHAEHMTDFLPGKIAALHSGLEPDEQRRRLRDFRSGKLDMLTTINKFNEGVDVPEANVAVLLRATESEAVFLQHIGRVLRRAPGKESALILDFVASWQRIEMVKSLASRVGDSYARRPARTRRQPHAMEAPFQFNFSEEAMNAIEVVKYARDTRQRKFRPQEPSKRITNANLAEEMLQAKLPRQHVSPEEAEAFAERIKLGDKQAIGKFVLRQLGKAYNIARQDAEGDAEFVQDYFQDICVKLLAKLSDFDSTKYNGSLNFYASTLMNSLNRGANDTYSLLPEFKRDALRNIDATAQKLEQELRRYPTSEEITEAADGKLDDVDIDKLLREHDQRTQPMPLTSLAEHLDEGADTETLTFNKLRDDWLQYELKVLGDSNFAIMAMRYGLLDEAPEEHSLTEIGHKVNISVQGVSNAIERGLQAVRDSAAGQRALEQVRLVNSALVVTGDNEDTQVRIAAQQLGYIVQHDYRIYSQDLSAATLEVLDFLYENYGINDLSIAERVAKRSQSAGALMLDALNRRNAIRALMFPDWQPY